MAHRTSVTDELNPGELQAREQFPSGYASSGIDQAEAFANDPQNATTGSPSITKNRDDADSAETNPVNPNSINFTGSGKPKEVKKMSFRKKRASAALIMTLIFGGGGVAMLGGTLTTALAPIAFIANVMSDLNDPLAALDSADTHLLRGKMPASERAKLIKGCKTLSIGCRFATISKTQLEALAQNSIKVNYDPAESKFGRIFPQSYTFQGETLSLDQMAEATKSTKKGGNSALKTAYRKAVNMKFLGANDSTFKGRVLKTLGVSKKAPELKGKTAQARVNELMNIGKTGDIGELKFKPAAEEGRYQLVTDDSEDPKTYSEAEKIKAENDLKGISNAKPPSALKSGVLKGLSITGWADIGCTIKNLIGLAAVGSKVSHYYDITQFAMPTLSLTHKIMAGDGTPEEAEAVGMFFTSSDNRKQLVDIKNSLTVNGDTIEAADGDATMMDNPNYGKNAMNSPLYNLSSTGKLSGMNTGAESPYSLGMGQNIALAGMATTALIIDSISNPTCKIIQSWAVRGAGIIIGIAAGIASMGSSLVATGSIAIGLAVALYALQNILHGILAGSPIPENISEAPVERGATAWVALSSLESESAKQRGMMPANKEEIMAYNTLRNDSKDTYVAVEQAKAKPLDIYNQHSFLGSIAYSLLPYMNSSTTVASTIGSAASFASRSLGMALNMSNASAKELDMSRFDYCDDVNYDKAGIDADVMCNVRYAMPQADLAMQPYDVNAYMESHGYVEPDSTTGLPPGYTLPEPAKARGFALDMINGVKNTFFADRTYVNDYAKYLDFCVNRVMPFGETYEETTQFGAAGEEWVDGSKCRETSEMMSNFRMYTLYKGTSEARDREAIDTGEAVADTPSTPGNSGGTGAVAGTAIKGDDLPWKDMAGVIGSSPLLYNYGECVDFVNWRLNAQAGIGPNGPFKTYFYGNAATWRAGAEADGHKVDQTPTLGSVAWWAPNVAAGPLIAGYMGHVAIVSQVNDDGSIIIEQYNGMYPPNDHQYNQVPLSKADISSLYFLHIYDIEPGSGY